MEKLEPYIKPYITKIDDAVGQLQRQIRQALQRAGGVVDDTFRLEPIAGETIETLGKDVVQESGEAAGRRILHEESGTVEEIQSSLDVKEEVQTVVADEVKTGIETSYGKSSGKYDTTADFLTNIENRNGKFYTDKATIDKIGQVEARGEDFSLLNKRIMSSRASTEGGTSVVYKYSDELGTKYLIHEVTDARGYIIHRDFDAVRISSGQLINKGH